MRPADTTLDDKRAGRVTARFTPATVRGWGAGAGAQVALWRPDSTDALCAAVAQLRDRASPGAIARGMGRSYGDAAQLARGLVIEMTQLQHFELDAGQGTVTAQAGVTIGGLLE